MCDTQVFFVYSWCCIHVVIFPSDHIHHGPQTPHPTWRQTHCSVTHSCTCHPCRNHHLLLHWDSCSTLRLLPTLVKASGVEIRYQWSLLKLLFKGDILQGWSWRSCVMFPMWVPHAPNPAAQQALSSPLDPGKDKNICFHFCCLGNVTGGSYGEH